MNGDKPVGLALYFFNYSTWTGRPGLYLEDLYVAPEYRKLGLGKAFFGELGKIAKETVKEFPFSLTVLTWFLKTLALHPRV